MNSEPARSRGKGEKSHGCVFCQWNRSQCPQKSKAAALSARRAAPDERQGRMQRGHVRRVYRSDRRRALPGLHAVHRCARRPSHPDCRGPDGRGKEALHLRLRRGRGRAVRFLHSRHGHLHEGAARSKPGPQRKRDQKRTAQQLLPLHGLCEDHRRREARGEAEARGRHPGAERERLEGRLERPPARRRGKGPRHGQISRRLVRPQHDLWLRRPREICARSRQGHRREQGAGHAGRLRRADRRGHPRRE